MRPDSSGLGFSVLVAPARQEALHAAEFISVATLLAGILSLAVYAIWRFDRTRRRARGARIRLLHVERRLASLQLASDSDTGERPVA